ncbi:GatB/YqeY domain-containing protein [Deferribacteraceae bacterium V6Fe1]|nr:GatB/YqeY domain-containing protein [Deferribacteraceae bacterium V6Fe1]
MDLINKISEDMKVAMKSKDSIALNTIRMLRAEIKNAEIQKMGQLSEDEIVKVIQTAIKKRKEAAEQYKNAGRDDLCEKELSEAKVLEKYLPEQLSEDKIKSIINQVIKEVGGNNFGLVMRSVMEKVQGRAEGKVVNQLVKEMLNGNN